MSSDILAVSKNFKPILFWARSYLENMRHEWPHENLAVVFDIDDTAIPVHTQQVLPEFKQLYDKAKQLQYSVFFITARIDHDNNDHLTWKQLIKAGFTNLDGLYLMPNEHLDQPNFSQFKHSIRQRLHDAGYNLVLNAGDAWHDLMLLAPYQTDSKSLSRARDIQQSVSKSEYAIFKPPDMSWWAIKFPEAPAIPSSPTSDPFQLW